MHFTGFEPVDRNLNYFTRWPWQLLHGHHALATTMTIWFTFSKQLKCYCAKRKVNLVSEHNTAASLHNTYMLTRYDWDFQDNTILTSPCIQRSSLVVQYTNYKWQHFIVPLPSEKVGNCKQTLILCLYMSIHLLGLILKESRAKDPPSTGQVVTHI